MAYPSATLRNQPNNLKGSYTYFYAIKVNQKLIKMGVAGLATFLLNEWTEHLINPSLGSFGIVEKSNGLPEPGKLRNECSQ